MPNNLCRGGMCAADDYRLKLVKCSAMHKQIKQWIRDSLTTLHEAGVLPAVIEPEVQLTRESSHGDYSSNIALALASSARLSARDLAARIVSELPTSDAVDKVVIAGPGFINFYLTEKAYAEVVLEIVRQGGQYGCAPVGSRGQALLEFVSANPTGPLHIGHGRGAAFGAALANILKANGYQVTCEYYVNDCGRQMAVLSLSMWLRYLELCGVKAEFPAKAYHGDYIWDMAAQLHRRQGEQFRISDWQPEVPTGTDDEAEEKHLDYLVNLMKQKLGTASYSNIYTEALNMMMDVIKKELKLFGISYDNWFFESSLLAEDQISEAIARLDACGVLYEKDGARWFRSTDFGDEKDRVLVRSNRQTTYFAADIAYHLDKYQKGYDLIVNIWGADHHGYVARLRAAISALGLDADKLHVLLVQFVNLYEGGQKTAMSTRGGQFIPLSAIRKQIGSDAMHLFYMMRKYTQHIDFDVELAKSQSNDNPLYYLQYAHARICSVFRQMEEQGYDYSVDTAELGNLDEAEARALMKSLLRYSSILSLAAETREPQVLLEYLRELAADFHSYYNRHRFLVEDEGLRCARLVLAAAVRCILFNGLTMLGASAPERM